MPVVGPVDFYEHRRALRFKRRLTEVLARVRVDEFAAARSQRLRTVVTRRRVAIPKRVDGESRPRTADDDFD